MHSLTLGDLVLTGIPALPDEEFGYWFEVAAEGTEFGSPEAVTRIVTSLLSDGAIVAYDSDGNRTIPVKVMVHGPDLLAVAQGEAALRRASKQSNELVWQPPDSFAPPSAFDTFPSAMSRDGGWDLDELRTRRTFNLSLVCAPFARSVEPVTVAALVAGGTPTTATITNADTTTGWTASKVVDNLSSAVTVTDMGAYLSATSATGTSGSFSMFLKYVTAGVSLATTRYVLVEASGTPPARFFMEINGIFGAYTPVLTRLNSSGTTLYVLDSGGGTFTRLDLSSNQYYGVRASQSVAFNVHDVSRSSAIPQVSARQQARVIQVGGTERTPASIRVKAPDGTSPLGLTIVHTSPESGSGYSPQLRRWRTGGNTVTADATTLSGAREPLHPNPVAFEVPTRALPTGGYLVCAFVRCGLSGTFTVNYNLATRLPPPNDLTVLGDTQNTARVNFPVANTWTLVPLGIVSLPTVRTSAGYVSVSIKRGTGETVDMLFDEAYLFRVDEDCALTIGDINASNLWLDSPSIDSPSGTARMGNSEAVTNYPGGSNFYPGKHVLHPDGTAVFAATLNVDNPEVSAMFYRLWHSNAAE